MNGSVMSHPDNEIHKDHGEVHDGELWTVNEPLEIADPHLFRLVNKEQKRQKCGLEMIASENFTSKAVLQCMSSCLNNKYSEGTVGRRYYGGNQYIDEIESLCQERSLKAFGLDPEKWGVNVQPYSGSPANFAVYTALVEPHGRIMGLDLPDGGHLTHGFFTAKKKISATSIFFESLPYKTNPETGLIDYDELERNAFLFKPKLIISGTTCYSRNLDYARFKKICDINGSYLMSDMSHISGLVAAGVVPSPFEFSDVVTSTTHKTLRGPRAGVIFYRKGQRGTDPKGNPIMYDIEEKINDAVFPGLQGGPHEHAIAAVATTMLHAASQEFKDYQKQVLKNAKVLCKTLQDKGLKIVTDGTDNHLILADLRSIGLSGAKAEAILEAISISVNKNTVPGDKSALNPSGIRIGTPTLTTRGFKEEETAAAAEFLFRGLMLAKEIQEKSGPKLLAWREVMLNDPGFKAKVQALAEEVEEYAQKFRFPCV